MSNNKIELKCLPYLKDRLSSEEIYQLLSYVSKHNNIKPILLYALCSLYKCPVELHEIENTEGTKKCSEFIKNKDVSCLCSMCNLSDTYCCEFILSEQLLLNLCMRQLSSIQAIENYINTHLPALINNYEDRLFASLTMIESTQSSKMICVPLHRYIFQYLKSIMVFSLSGLYNYLLEHIVGLDESQNTFLNNYIANIYEINPKKISSLETLLETITTDQIDTQSGTENVCENNTTDCPCTETEKEIAQDFEVIAEEGQPTTLPTPLNTDDNYPSEESWDAFSDTDVWQDSDSSLSEDFFDNNMVFPVDANDTEKNSELPLDNFCENALEHKQHIENIQHTPEKPTNMSNNVSEENTDEDPKTIVSENGTIQHYLNENGFLKNSVKLSNIKDLTYINTLKDRYMLKYALVRNMDIAIECIVSVDDNTSGFLFYMCEERYFYYLPFNKDDSLLHGTLSGIFKDTARNIYTMFAVPVLYYIQKYGYEIKKLISLCDLYSIINNNYCKDPKDIIRTVTSDFSVPEEDFIPYGMVYYRNIARKFSHKYSNNVKKALSSKFYKDIVVAKSYKIKRFINHLDAYISLKEGRYIFSYKILKNKSICKNGNFLVARYENKVVDTGRYVAAFNKIVEKLFTTNVHQSCNFILINLDDSELCFFVEEHSIPVFISVFDHLLIKSGKRYVAKIPQVQLLVKTEYFSNNKSSLS